jgi:hypothetical protein
MLRLEHMPDVNGVVWRRDQLVEALRKAETLPLSVMIGEEKLNDPAFVRTVRPLLIAELRAQLVRANDSLASYGVSID